jgi:hypothetical protein
MIHRSVGNVSTGPRSAAVPDREPGSLIITLGSAAASLVLREPGPISELNVLAVNVDVRTDRGVGGECGEVCVQAWGPLP